MLWIVLALNKLIFTTMEARHERERERVELARYLQTLGFDVCERGESAVTYDDVSIPRWKNSFRLMRRRDKKFLTFSLFGHYLSIFSWPLKRRVIGELDLSERKRWTLHVFGTDEVCIMRPLSCLLSSFFRTDVILNIHDEQVKELLPHVSAPSPALQ